MAPDQYFKLDSLQDSTAGSLTADEKEMIRSLQLTDDIKKETTLAQEAGKVTIETDEGEKTINDFIKQIKTGISSLTVDVERKTINRQNMDRAQKKTSINNFITKTPIFGKVLGRSSELVALIQIVVKPLGGADGIPGPNTMDALMAYNPSNDTKTNDIVDPPIERANIHTVSSTRIESDAKQVNLLSSKEALSSSDKEALKQAQQDGYITMNTNRGNNIAYPTTTKYNDDKETILITSSSSKADLILDARKLYRKEKDGSMTMDRKAFGEEFIAAMTETMKTEAGEEINRLNNTYTTIESKFKTMDTSDITPDQIKAILLHPERDARKRREINNNIATLKSIISSISSIDRSSKDIASSDKKDTFMQKVKGLEAEVANALQKRQNVVSFLTIFTKDKENREKYIHTFVNYNRSGSNHDAIVNEGKDLLASLNTKAIEIKKHDQERGGAETNYGYLAYQEAIKVMKGLKVAGNAVFTKQTGIV